MADEWLAQANRDGILLGKQIEMVSYWRNGLTAGAEDLKANIGLWYLDSLDG